MICHVVSLAVSDVHKGGVIGILRYQEFQRLHSRVLDRGKRQPRQQFVIDGFEYMIVTVIANPYIGIQYA